MKLQNVYLTPNVSNLTHQMVVVVVAVVEDFALDLPILEPVLFELLQLSYVVVLWQWPENEMFTMKSRHSRRNIRLIICVK